MTADLSKRLHDYTGGFMNMTDSVLMMFLLVRNISSSMNSVSFMSGDREKSIQMPNKQLESSNQEKEAE